jgi:hypothetical protein
VKLCVWPAVFVCMLLGDGGLLLCIRGVFFGVGQRHNNGVAFSLCGLFFGVRSGAVAWQRHYIRSSIFFGVCSGAVAWQ